MPASDTQVGGDHYKKLGIEPWAALRAWLGTEGFAAFLKGCVIKYVVRKKANPVEDLKKARHCLDKLIEVMEEQSGRD
jgi:Protein of unknwon function (DUF3310)